MEETSTQVWPAASDPEAFVQLMWHHGPALYGYLRRRAGSDAGDDLLAEVWMRAFRARATYDPRLSGSLPWLYGIARNVLRAEWRRSSRRRIAFEAALVDPWPEVDCRIDASALRSQLIKAVKRLSDDEREVLLLVAWEQLSPADAAVVLGIPQGTARSRLHRARTRMRDDCAGLTSMDDEILDIEPRLGGVR